MTHDDRVAQLTANLSRLQILDPSGWELVEQLVETRLEMAAAARQAKQARASC